MFLACAKVLISYISSKHIFDTRDFIFNTRDKTSIKFENIFNYIYLN